MFSEEPGPDIQGLADMKRHVCGGMGHMARSCATPNPKGGGKGGKAGGKGLKGGPKGETKGRAKGVGEGQEQRSIMFYMQCNKIGHLPDRCWKTYPELQRKKKIQRIEGEGGEEDRGSGGIEVCACTRLYPGPI